MVEPKKRFQELQKFTKSLGVCLDDFSLLDQALTHASAAEAAAALPNYESLEFLGDAVLGMVTAQWLYEEVPGCSPGEYSQMRAGVVNRDALAGVAERLGLIPLIRLGKGEERAGGRERKALHADCVEAIIAALYIELGWDVTRDMVIRAFHTELEQAKSTEIVWDYKSRLQNYCQARYDTVPSFGVVQESGPDHQKVFEIEVRLRDEVAGRGIGHSKKEAEQSAAREALVREGEIDG